VPSQDFWIGFGFFVLAIVAAVITIPHQGANVPPSRSTKIFYWVLVPFAIAFEIVVQRFSLWLAQTHSMTPMEFSIGVNLGIFLIAAAIRVRANLQRARRQTPW
jgi:hypothetical protein